MALENTNNLNTRLCAGVLAAYLQLARGTKYSQFPRWLDAWLRMRKHLGLLMLLSASIHGCFYCLLYAPPFRPVQIPAPDIANSSWDWSRTVVVSGGTPGRFEGPFAHFSLA